MNFVEVLEGIWNQILDVMSLFVMPDWGGLIGLLPILVLLGLVGPFITFLALGTVIYLIRKPRVKVSFVEGARRAEIGTDGEPIFPVGLPYCRRDALVYPSGTHLLRPMQGQTRRHLPDVRARARRVDRHLHELRPRPQGQAKERGRHGDLRPEARRRGGGLRS